MARIRYIGEHLIARAFERTFHRDHWDEDHGLHDDQVATLACNPQFEVDNAGCIAGRESGPVETPEDVASGSCP